MGVPKLDDLAGNIELEIPSQIQIDRTNGSEHDTAHDGPLNPIIQKPFLHPPPIAELLSHRHSPATPVQRLRRPLAGLMQRRRSAPRSKSIRFQSIPEDRVFPRENTMRARPHTQA